MKKTAIKLEIKNCSECPFFTRERHYTADSWDEAYNWFCNHGKQKEKISEYVEWYDVKNEKVPDWCPILIK